MIGKNLRKLRDRKHISQKDLAERAGIAPSTISHFESGKRQPNLKNLVRLCLALNVSSDVLLGLDKQEWCPSCHNEKVVWSCPILCASIHFKPCQECQTDPDKQGKG